MTRHGRRPAGRHQKHVNKRNNDATILKIKQSCQPLSVSFNFQLISATSTEYSNFYFSSNVSISTVRDVIHSAVQVSLASSLIWKQVDPLLRFV